MQNIECNPNQNFQWFYNSSKIDWDELSNLYKIAPLGDKKVVFANSKYKFCI